MSNYSAMVVKLENVQKHPNADRLLIATAAEEPVVIGLDHVEGEIGVFFPAGTVIAHEFLMANNLYRKNPETLEPMGGYFESNRRVRFQKFRGQMSRGIWLPMTSLDYLCLEKNPVLGTEFQELEGHEIISKYVAPSARPQGLPGKPRSKKYENFYEIGETPKLVLNYNRFKLNDVLVITEKLHGTSGRTGYLRRIQKQPYHWWEKLWAGVQRYLHYGEETIEQWDYVTGTRRMVLGENSPDDSNYRIQAHNLLKPHLSKGMIVYYEIVGKVSGMATHTPHGIEDKTLKKDLIAKYGESIDYTYGVADGEFDIYVYKIVEHNIEGNPIVYSWDQLVRWCNNHDIKHVPVLDITLFEPPVMMYASTDVNPHKTDAEVGSEEWNLVAAKDNLKWIIQSLCEGHSVLDERHPKEGVVVQTKYGPFKHKSDVFCILEDIRPYEEPEFLLIEE